MTPVRSIIFRLRGDRRGVTAVEFALLTPAMLLTICGFLEAGYQTYLSAVLQGAVNEAGRNTTLEDAANNTTSIDQKVKKQILNISHRATFDISRKSYSSFQDVGNPEPFNDDNNNGVRDANECYQDLNGNKTFDQDRGKDGLGGPDDIVKYTVTVTYPRIMPTKIFGWVGKGKISASTVLRNQPYGAQTAPTVVCAK